MSLFLRSASKQENLAKERKKQLRIEAKEQKQKTTPKHTRIQLQRAHIYVCEIFHSLYKMFDYILILTMTIINAE